MSLCVVRTDSMLTFQLTKTYWMNIAAVGCWRNVFSLMYLIIFF